MASKNLKEFAASLSFENKNNRYFGDYQGYSITLAEGGGRKTLIIGMTLPRDDSRLNQMVGFVENNKKEKKIVEYSIHPSHLSIAIQDGKGVIERLTALMNDGIRMLQEMGIPGSSVCWYCQSELPAGTEKIQVNEAVIPMHSGCIESFSRNVEQAADEFHKEQKNYGRGFVGALIGGILGVIPWVIVYLLGYFVGILGILIGFATKKGYELMGGKPGRAKAWIVLLVVIVCVLLGQFIGDYIELYNALVDEGFENITLSDLNDWYSILMEDSEILFSTIKNILIGVAFAFAGIYDIFRDLRKEGKGNIATVKRLQ